MTKIIILAFSLFALPFQIYAVQNMNMDNRAGEENSEFVIQQGKEVKVDQVEISEEEDEITPGRGESQGYQGAQAIQTRTSEVGQYVQELLNDPDLENTEIGQKVRQVAMEQNQTQKQIQENVRAIESRGRVMRFFFGSDRQAVEGLENQLKQTRQRLDQLEEFSNQAPTEDIRVRIQAAMTTLEDQSEALNQAITAERQVKGIFGFLPNLFHSFLNS